MSNAAEQVEDQLKDQGDLDLERVMSLFDQALISNDERVINALRSLLMIVALTAPEDPNEIKEGPWHRLSETVYAMNDRMRKLEAEIQDLKYTTTSTPWKSPGSGPWTTGGLGQPYQPTWITAPNTSGVVPPTTGITGVTYTSTTIPDYSTSIKAKMTRLGLDHDEILKQLVQDLKTETK